MYKNTPKTISDRKLKINTNNTVLYTVRIQVPAHHRCQQILI